MEIKWKPKLCWLAAAAALFLACSSVSGPVCAEIESDRPDLSIFKLKKVDTKALARERVQRPLEDLAQGAIHMRESLFVDSYNVKCPTYAQLFRLMKRQAKLKLASKIRQDTVEVLAIMVNSERAFYHQLFVDGATYAAADYFIEALEALELQQQQDSNQRVRDAWLDLVSCMSIYMVTDPMVERFLRQPTRADALALLSKFKAIPVEPIGKGAPSGLVCKLASKYSDRVPDQFGRLSAKAFHEATELISQLEDDETKEARRKFNRFYVKDELYQPLDEDLELSEKEIRDTKGLPVELLVATEEQPAAEAQQPVEQEPVREIEAAKVAFLKYIRSRIDRQCVRRYERVPKLSMQLAFDFMSHWEDLHQAKLDPTSDIGRHALEFKTDIVNVAISRRIRHVVRVYTSLTSLVSTMQSQEGAYRSMDEFRLQYEELTDLLDSMDPFFDVDDLRRVHKIWLHKYIEYDVLNNFIKSAPWWG